jgi:hypothetical protein
MKLAPKISLSALALYCGMVLALRIGPHVPVLPAPVPAPVTQQSVSEAATPSASPLRVPYWRYFDPDKKAASLINTFVDTLPPSQQLPTGGGSRDVIGACTGNQPSPDYVFGPTEDGVHCMAVADDRPGQRRILGSPGQRWILVLPMPYCPANLCGPDIRRAETTSGVVATASPSAEQVEPPVMAFSDPGS